MDLRTMHPKDAATIDLATNGGFLEALGALLDDPQVDDVHVVLEHGPPRFLVHVLGVSGERIVVEHELGVAALLPERVRLGLLLLWIDQLLVAHAKWVRVMNPKLAAVGARQL